MLFSLHGLLFLVTYSQEFPQRLLYQKISLQGVVSSLPEDDSDKTQFLFKTEFGLVSLYWSKRFKPAPVFKPGQLWSLSVKLKEPRGFMNKGLFSYGDWLKHQGIMATGYIDVNQDNHLVGDKYLSEPVNKIRYNIQNKLKILVGEGNSFGLLQALILGDKSGLSKSQKRLFQSTGTSHLIAISGLHIGLIFLWFFILFRVAWSCSIRLCNFLPAQIFGMWIGLGAAIFYSFLADFAVSTQRAIIMLSVYVLTRTFGFNLSARRVLTLAFVLVILWQPLSIFDAGFWLSFTAVAFLIYCLLSRVGRSGKIVSWVYPQFMIVVALIPLTVYWFGSISGVAFLANLIVIPLVSFIIVPGAFVALFLGFCSINVFGILSYIVVFLYYILSNLGRLISIVEINNSFSYAALIMSVLGMVLIFSPRGFLLRLLGGLMVCPILFYQVNKPGNGEFRLYVLDAGQGLATIVETKSHVVVYDTGPKFFSGSTSAEVVLVPFLKTLGINKIDILVISHSDLDHSGGVDDVLSAFDVNEIYVSQDDNPYEHKAVLRCQESDLFQLDGIKFEFLNPSNEKKEIYSDNNLSCVLKVSNHHQSVLLPGDIERKMERYLTKYHYGQLSASILVAPHHGSNSSSTSQFIEAVNPEYVVYATGFKNQFHFPSLKTVKRYKKLNIQQLDTGNCGSIIFDISKKIEVESYVAHCQIP